MNERRMAINRLRDRLPVDSAAVDRFVARHGSPIIEGERATFLFRGEADEVSVRHRVVGLPDPLDAAPHRGDRPVGHEHRAARGVARGVPARDPRRGEHHERFNDPLNPRVAHSPMGSSSVCAAVGYRVPEWVHHDPEARPGELRRGRHAQQGPAPRPARARSTCPPGSTAAMRYPLLVVHDGTDYLGFAAMKTVLDNLIHRLDIAPMVVAFVPPRDRLKEYPNHAPHARFIARELVPRLGGGVPAASTLPRGAASWAAASAASPRCRRPCATRACSARCCCSRRRWSSPTSAIEHGGGPDFDPVVKFVNRYRARPTRPVDRIFMSCGIYEPLITPNRSMVPVFRGTGMTVNYTESRDGHNWENWRDRLREGLSWVFPGPQKFVYE